MVFDIWQDVVEKFLRKIDEFTPDWRSVRAGLERINLNRPLPPFPHQGSGSSPPFGAPLCGPGERFDSPQAASQFHDALFDKLDFLPSQAFAIECRP